MREFAPTDEQFKRQFIAAQISRQSSSRYILTEFEQNLRPTEELKVQTSKRVHVEHIYPQTPLQGERLPNHHSVVNRIGNQTLLAKQLNQSIQNAQFADKIAAYAQSDLLITKNLTKFTSWGEQAIDERQEMMSEIAPTIWKF